MGHLSMGDRVHAGSHTLAPYLPDGVQRQRQATLEGGYSPAEQPGHVLNCQGSKCAVALDIIPMPRCLFKMAMQVWLKIRTSLRTGRTCQVLWRVQKGNPCPKILCPLLRSCGNCLKPWLRVDALNHNDLNQSINLQRVRAPECRVASEIRRRYADGSCNTAPHSIRTDHGTAPHLLAAV